MELSDLRELEDWLEFPIDYAEGIIILAKLRQSPSYRIYVERVADAALRPIEDVESDVITYLANAPKRTRSVQRVGKPVETARIVPKRPVEHVHLVQIAEYPLAKRCHYCGNDAFYTREETRMTGSGKFVFVITLLLLGFFALIPYLLMRERYYTTICRNCNRKQN